MSFLRRLRRTPKDPRLREIQVGLEAVGGLAYVAPPLGDVYQRTWGVINIESLHQYYNIYYNVPYVKNAIDMMADLSVRRGYKVVGGKEEYRAEVEEMVAKMDIVEATREMIRLGLVYGTSYAEILFENPPEPVAYEEIRPIYNLPTFTQLSSEITMADSFMIQEDYDKRMLEELNMREELGRPIALKTLDPRYIRVLGDSRGRVWGFIQWYAPPIYLRKYQMFYWVHDRKSELFEYYYGNSVLRPLLRIQALITQLENDITLAIHYQAYTPIKAKIGNEKYRPTLQQQKEIETALRERKVGSNIIVPWFVDVEWMNIQAGVIPRLEWFMRHLLREREQALGIPRLFFGEIGGVSRTVGELLLQELENKLLKIQQSISATFYHQVIAPTLIAEHGALKSSDMPRLEWNKPITGETRQRMLSLLDLLEKEALDEEERQRVIKEILETSGVETD